MYPGAPGSFQQPAGGLFPPPPQRPSEPVPVPLGPSSPYPGASPPWPTPGPTSYIPPPQDPRVHSLPPGSVVYPGPTLPTVPNPSAHWTYPCGCPCPGDHRPQCMWRLWEQMHHNYLQNKDLMTRFMCNVNSIQEPGRTWCECPPECHGRDLGQTMGLQQMRGVTVPWQSVPQRARFEYQQPTLPRDFPVESETRRMMEEQERTKNTWAQFLNIFDMALDLANDVSKDRWKAAKRRREQARLERLQRVEELRRERKKAKDSEDANAKRQQKKDEIEPAEKAKGEDKKEKKEDEKQEKKDEKKEEKKDDKLEKEEGKTENKEKRMRFIKEEEPQPTKTSDGGLEEPKVEINMDEPQPTKTSDGGLEEPKVEINMDEPQPTKTSDGGLEEPKVEIKMEDPDEVETRTWVTTPNGNGEVVLEANSNEPVTSPGTEPPAPEPFNT